MNRKWTLEEINSWYNSYPWLTGSNFLPSNVVNRLDMYQSYKSDEHLECADKELALHAENGFNTVRLWLNFDCYYLEKEKYLDILEKYIALCAKHNQYVMLVLTHEEDLPWEEKFIPVKLGEQTRYYTHFNRDYKTYLEMTPYKKHYYEYEELRPIFLEMIEVIVKKYRNDPRIFAWNLYNEPGITLHERAIPILDALFSLVRSLDPIQPLSADVWTDVDEKGIPLNKEEAHAMELSDFISFHSYNKINSFKRKVLAIKNNDSRPIFMTEWLNRVNHNNVEDVYPFLKENNIAAYCWGFVNGDTYTDEPWEILWDEYEKSEDFDYDMSKWQHNLFRKNHRPYDPKEMKLIRKLNGK